MVKQFSMLGGNETEKKNFHSSKSLLAMNDIDINEIVMYDGYAYGKNKKYSLPFFNEYMHDIKIMPFYIHLPKMSGNVNRSKETKCKSFEIKNNEL